MQAIDQQVQITIKDYLGSPLKLRLLYMVPFGLGLSGKRNRQVVEILALLDALGLRKLMLPAAEDGGGTSTDLDIISKLNDAIASSDNKKTAALIFVEKLYEIFEVLNKRNIDQFQPGILKLLKKSIHQFVEKNNIQISADTNTNSDSDFDIEENSGSKKDKDKISDKKILAKNVINLKKLAIQEEEKQKTAGFFKRIWHGAQRWINGETVFRTKTIGYGLSTEGKLNPYLAYKLQQIESDKVGPYIIMDETAIAEDIRQVLEKLRTTTNSPLLQGISKDVAEVSDDVIDALVRDAMRLVKNAHNKLLPMDAAKKKNRRIKKFSDVLAEFVDICMGISQGMVAGILSGFTLAIAIPIMIMGGTTNYILFGAAIKSVFRTLFLGRIYKGNDGREVSNLRKILITISLIFSGAAGIASGALAYASTVTAISKIILLVAGILGIGAIAAFPPVGIIILAGFISVVTAISAWNVLYVVGSDFIKNDRLGKIKAFFIKHYGLPGYEKASVAEWAQHILKCSFLSIGILLAVGITAFTTVGLAGRLHFALINFLAHSVNLSVKISTVLSAIIIYAMTAPLRFLFLAEGNAKVLVGLSQGAYKLLMGIGSFICHPVNNIRSAANALASFIESPFTAISKAKNFIKRTVLLNFAVANGAGNGIGSEISGGLVHNLLPFISEKLGGVFSGFGTAISSFGINAKQIIVSTQATKSVSYAKVTDKTRAKANKLFKENRVLLNRTSLEKASKNKFVTKPNRSLGVVKPGTNTGFFEGKTPANFEVVAKGLAQRRIEKLATNLNDVFAMHG